MTPAAGTLCALGLLGMVGSTVLFVARGRYVQGLGWVDASTLAMIGGLVAWVGWRRRTEGWSATVGLGAIVVAGFLALFEAVYKFWFFGWVVEGAERRALALHLLQAGGLAWVTAQGVLRWRGRVTRLALGGAVGGFAFWLAIGYPQLFPMTMSAPVEVAGVTVTGYPRLLPVELSNDAVYLLNRLVKLAWCVALASALRPPVQR